jgi:hypothetical protein
MSQVAAIVECRLPNACHGINRTIMSHRFGNNDISTIAAALPVIAHDSMIFDQIIVNAIGLKDFSHSSRR